MAQKRIRDAQTDIVVLDAAVLLEASWDTFVHQVWTVFVPQDEAIKRVQDRDNLPAEQVLMLESDIWMVG